MLHKVWLGLVGALAAIGAMAGVVMVLLAFVRVVGPWLQGLGVMTDKDAGAVGALAFLVAGMVGILALTGALMVVERSDDE